jgi:hypothetical protein
MKPKTKQPRLTERTMTDEERARMAPTQSTIANVRDQRVSDPRSLR